MACTPKPLSMANGCLISSPSIFTPKTSSYPPNASIPFLTKPTTKLQLSCSFSISSSISFSALRKNTHSPSFVTFVAAQQDEDNTLVLEQEEADEELDAPFSESEGEETVATAVGDAAAEEEEETAEFTQPPEDAKIFIGNLPYDVDSEGLAKLFEEAGVVEIAEVIYNRETDQSRGFGFVTMSTVEEAEKAVEMFNSYQINGRSLTVNKAAPRGTQTVRAPREFGPSYRVYVGNLPWDFDNAQLEQIFSEHGKVVNARVVIDRDSGRSRGFGFVTMSSESEMNDAIESLDGQSFGGRPLRVNVAEDRPRRGGF